jgi:hypothetical protein
LSIFVDISNIIFDQFQDVPPEASSQPAANQHPVHDPEVYPEVYPEVCSEGYPAGRVMGQGQFRTIACPIQATSLLIFVVLCLYVEIFDDVCEKLLIFVCV